MSSEREFNIKLFGVKFKYLSELVKNLLEEQDRKVSNKLLRLFLCKRCSLWSRMGCDCIKTCHFWAATQSIVYVK